MKFSKTYPEWKRKRLYGIYVYFGYNNKESFEKFCLTYDTQR